MAGMKEMLKMLQSGQRSEYVTKDGSGGSKGVSMKDAIRRKKLKEKLSVRKSEYRPSEELKAEIAEARSREYTEEEPEMTLDELRSFNEELGKKMLERQRIKMRLKEREKIMGIGE